MPSNPNLPKRGLRPSKYISDFKAPAPPPPPPDFPAVGMTLSTYKHDPFAKMKQTATPKPSRWSRIRAGINRKRAIWSVVAVLVLAVGWLGWKFGYNLHKLFGGDPFSIFTTTKLRGEDVGRVNILLAGNSADDPGHQGGNLTDSIMIISIDTRDNTAFMLSVPRDLYVNIPGNGYEKINAAYPDGNADHFSASGYPSGGMGQLEEIVSQDFGIPIDYYALVNYEALKEMVNEVGGITININSSDPRGIYDPDIDYATGQPLARYSNGPHTLNGEQALDLARARGDAYGSYGFAASDFMRTANQRAMLLSLKGKVDRAGFLANPVKLGELFDTIGRNVKTDFKAGEVHRLYDLTKQINSNNIASVGLNNVDGQNLLTNYTAPDGESALVPAAGINNYSAIQNYMRRLTSNNPIVKEDAKIIVLNGTTISGLAATQATLLEAKDVDVTYVGDADTFTLAQTEVIKASGASKPATRKLLDSIYGNAAVTSKNPYKGTYKADFIIVVGRSQQNTNSGSAP